MIESGIESAAAVLAAALIALVIDNIVVVLLVVVIAAGIWIIYSMHRKRKQSSYSLKRTAELQRETETKLQSLLVSDTFKELELGLVQGETASRMQEMEQVAYTLLEQAHQLGKKLAAHRPSYVSNEESDHLTSQLEAEAEDLWRRSNHYLHDLSGIGAEVKGTAVSARALEACLFAIAEQIDKLSLEAGAPLEELTSQLSRVQSAFKQADQLAAFDAVRASPELRRVSQLLNQLQSRVKTAAAELHRDR